MKWKNGIIIGLFLLTMMGMINSSSSTKLDIIPKENVVIDPEMAITADNTSRTTLYTSSSPYDLKINCSSMSVGAVINGYFETNKFSYLLPHIYILNATEYAKYPGSSFKPNLNITDKAYTSFSFTVPTSGNYYVVFTNDDGNQTITLDYYVDKQGRTPTTYKESEHTLVKNLVVLDAQSKVLTSVYLLRGPWTLEKDDQISIGYTGVFSGDSIDCYILDQNGYEEYIGGDYSPEKYEKKMTGYSNHFENFSVSNDGKYYIILSNAGKSHIATISVYVDIYIPPDYSDLVGILFIGFFVVGVILLVTIPKLVRNHHHVKLMKEKGGQSLTPASKKSSGKRTIPKEFQKNRKPTEYSNVAVPTVPQKVSTTYNPPPSVTSTSGLFAPSKTQIIDEHSPSYAPLSDQILPQDELMPPQITPFPTSPSQFGQESPSQFLSSTDLLGRTPPIQFPAPIIFPKLKICPKCRSPNNFVGEFCFNCDEKL